MLSLLRTSTGMGAKLGGQNLKQGHLALVSASSPSSKMFCSNKMRGVVAGLKPADSTPGSEGRGGIRLALLERETSREGGPK